MNERKKKVLIWSKRIALKIKFQFLLKMYACMNLQFLSKEMVKETLLKKSPLTTVKKS